MGFSSDEDEPEVPINLRREESRPLLKPLPVTHAGRGFEIIIYEPRIYEDSLNVASYLRQNRPVLLNLKYLDAEAGKRLIDFVCGTTYAINGHMLKVGESIFLFTPENVAITEAEEKANLDKNLEGERDAFFRSR
jgi:cell division inhibitor SepF